MRITKRALIHNRNILNPLLLPPLRHACVPKRTSACRHAILDARMLVAWKAEMDKPLFVDQSRRFLQQLDAAQVVFD